MKKFIFILFVVFLNCNLINAAEFRWSKQSQTESNDTVFYYNITSSTGFFNVTDINEISDYIEVQLKKNNMRPIHIEGKEHFEWVLMDYVNIVINIFNKEKRDYYNIERLWSDAKITRIKSEDNT